WNHITGRGKVIPDGDFIRLNKFDTDAEKEFAISLQLMAGGPVTPSDMPDTMGDNVRFYTNEEMLALNADRFVGKPLSDKLTDKNSQIWFGQMSDGSHIIGLFNRDDAAVSRTVSFSDLGISGEWNVRDLWKHEDEGKASSVSAVIPAHGCKIVKLTK
ncbi:MAG: glucan 1,6-alpha-isomaltosidase, partial [Bacteroidales bacterium]|nr:glucan 1,6-alpha-isomaltosidase [Bacteroidales bacterium]